MTNQALIKAENAALEARRTGDLFTFARELVVAEMFQSIMQSAPAETTERDAAYFTIKAADEIFARLDYLANCAQERKNNG